MRGAIACVRLCCREGLNKFLIASVTTAPFQPRTPCLTLHAIAIPLLDKHNIGDWNAYSSFEGGQPSAEGWLFVSDRDHELTFRACQRIV